MTTSIETPNPGSEEAIKQGCMCPVMDNRYGKGAYMDGNKPVFWYSSDCKLHCDNVDLDEDVPQ